MQPGRVLQATEPQIKNGGLKMDRKELIEMLNAIKNSPDGYFGIRSENYKYNIGDTCFKSRQLYQDPVYDEITNELVYPYIEDGIYAGFYDGGELDGTSVTQIGSLNLHEDFLEEDLETLNNAIKQNKMYDGKHQYIVSGTIWNNGNDYGEVILSNAEVIYIIK
jgi:hypothetical protein